jgi:hypothetical protein
VLGQGFNAVTAQQLLLPVFQWHFDGSTTYTPSGAGSPTWEVPMELVVSNIDASRELIVEGIYEKYSMYASTVYKGFNFGIGIGTSAFSLAFNFSKEMYKAKMEIDENNKAAGWSNHWWAAYQLQAYPVSLLTINPMLKLFVTQLNPNPVSRDDIGKYDQLLQTWGTHYFNLCNFGGQVDVNTFVNQTMIQKKSEQWAAEQMSFTFHYYMFDISGGGFKNKSDIHIDNDFLKSAITSIYFKGGDLGLQSNETVGEWMKTITHYPVSLNCTCNPISDVIPNAAVKAKVFSYIQSYTSSGKLPLQVFDEEAELEQAKQAEQEALEGKKVNFIDGTVH